MFYLEFRRKELGILQKDVADRAHMHPVVLGCIERGRYRPTPDELTRLASALATRPQTLMQTVQIVHPEEEVAI